jgi:hypothetical protein
MRKLLNLLYNFHWVVPGEAARSSQAHMGGLETFLAANGLKAVINLRGRHPGFPWWDYETAASAHAGAVHLDAMLDSRRLPLRAMLVALFDAFDAAPKPFVVKCSGGQDRTSLASALYIVHRDGWSAVDRALGQFRPFPFLHVPRKHQLWLRTFLVYAREDAKGAKLAAWVRDTYDPQAFAAWLIAHGMAERFDGIWEPWKPPVRR